MRLKVNELTIKLWRLNITNAQIAEQFGVTPEFVSMALHGKRRSPLALQIKSYVEDLIKKGDAS